MNRLRLAIRVLVRGEAALRPAAVRPEHQTARPAGTGQPSDAKLQPVSDIIRQLIALRDSVQAAAADLDGPGNQALNAAARQLAQIMTSEHVVPIEGSGAFDARRQNVVARMQTGNKALDYQVASSVRSGYLRNGALIRRQDVIVYRFTDDRTQGTR